MINRLRGTQVAIAALGTAIGVAAFALTLARDHDELRAVGHPDEAGFVVAIGWSFIASGLIAWVRRPQNRFGPLLIAVGMAWFAAALGAANNPLPFSIGLGLAGLWIALFFHALLAFPTGRLDSRLARWLVGVAYLDMIVVQVAWVAFADVHTQAGCSGCPDNLLLIADRPNLARAILLIEQPILGFALLTGGIVVLLRRWRDATPASRRALAPVFASGGLCLLVLALTVFLEPFSYRGGQVIGWVGGLAFTAVPLAFLAGLARARFDRIAVGDLVVALGESPRPEQLRDAIARALGDPTVEVVYWLPDVERYADIDGRLIALPRDDPRRAATLVEREGRRVAAIVHDDALSDDPELLRAVSAAAALALENARLQAQLRARLDELEASRARIVEAADLERKRIERNLHDATQQRLTSVTLALGLAESQLASDPEAAQRSLAQAKRALAAALAELRDLSQDIHPSVLSEGGLPSALEDLAYTAPLPVRISADLDERFPEQVEVGAYYVVAEALTNVAKHAHASRATVIVAREDGRLALLVRDDGVGGVDPTRGSGLRGLADRIQALGGTFEFESGPGRGTEIRARIPCA